MVTYCINLKREFYQASELLTGQAWSLCPLHTPVPSALEEFDSSFMYHNRSPPFAECASCRLCDSGQNLEKEPECRALWVRRAVPLGGKGRPPENRKQWWEDGGLHLALSPACEPCTPNLHGDCPDPGPTRAAPLHFRPVSSVAQSSPTLCDPVDCKSITNSRILLKLTFIESVMPSNYLILCSPLLLPSLILPSIRVFSSESVLRIRWPKYWRFSLSYKN